jgi:hypothetical protein
MPRDTRWRLILCWGAVLTFLTLPLAIFVIALLHPELVGQIKEYKFLSKFFESITALVFGLAGLRSLDKYVETKNGKDKSPKIFSDPTQNPEK